MVPEMALMTVICVSSMTVMSVIWLYGRNICGIYEDLFSVFIPVLRIRVRMVKISAEILITKTIINIM
jgi:hypothetical protein